MKNKTLGKKEKKFLGYKEYLLLLLLILISSLFIYFAFNREELEMVSDEYALSQKPILFFLSSTDELRRIESLDKNKIYNKVFDFKLLSEIKDIRLSKYNALVIPYEGIAFEDKLKKYYDAGISIFLYKKGKSEIKLSPGTIFSEVGKNQDYIEVDMKDVQNSNIVKPVKISLVKKSSDELAGFNLIGVSKRFDKISLVNFDETDFLSDNKDTLFFENYLLNATINSYRFLQKKKERNGLFENFEIINYSNNGKNKTRLVYDMYRDYSNISTNEYYFSIYSILSASTKESFMNKLFSQVELDGYCSILSSSPDSFNVEGEKKIVILDEESLQKRDQYFENMYIEFTSFVSPDRKVCNFISEAQEFLPKSISGNEQIGRLSFVTDQFYFRLKPIFYSEILKGSQLQNKITDKDMCNIDLIVEF